MSTINLLKDAKNYGVIGTLEEIVVGVLLGGLSLLNVSRAVEFSVGLLMLIGFALEVLAINKISKVLNDREIFNNFLFSYFIPLVVSALLAVFALGTVAENIMNAVIALFILYYLSTWVAFIISAIFLKKSFDSIASKLNVPLFSKVAFLYLIGAVTEIIFIGSLIMFAAAILKVAAYSNLPESLPPLAQSNVQELHQK